MAKTMSINTDIMVSRLDLPRFKEFPNHEETLEFPQYEEPPEFCEVDQSTAIMDISTSPRSSVPPTNKALDNIVSTPVRKPSPQPTHFSVPPKNGNGNGHRVLRSATVGYIAPEFKGKAAQMLQGMLFLRRLKSCSDIL